jgi:hypothetical protein
MTMPKAKSVLTSIAFGAVSLLAACVSDVRRHPQENGALADRPQGGRPVIAEHTRRWRNRPDRPSEISR